MSTAELLGKQEYKYGFVTDIESDVIPRGLTEDTIRLIVGMKNAFSEGVRVPRRAFSASLFIRSMSSGSNSILRMTRAAAAEKSRRSGRISRERIANSLSGVSAMVAIGNSPA